VRTWSVVAVLAAVLVGLHIHAYTALSPDEPHHVDYVYRLLDGQVPASGDRWVPATDEVVSCRTIDAPGTAVARCGSRSPTGGSDRGLTTAFHQTPVYYLVPAAAVLLGSALDLPVEDVDLMRATGPLWLLVALWLLWLLWRDSGVLWQTRIGLSVALTAAPVVLLAQASVTNTASALTAGAAVTLATVHWDRGRVGLWLPVGTIVLALLLKATNLAVVLAACAFVLVRAVQIDPGPSPSPWRAALSRRTLLFVGSSGLASAVVGLGWWAISRSRATTDERLIPRNASLTVTNFDLGWLATAAGALISPLRPEFYQSVFTGSGAAVVVGTLVDVGVLVLCVVGAVRSEPGSTVRALAASTGVAALAAGPVLTVAQYLVSGIHSPVPAHYGFSLVPALLVIAGTAVRTRLGGIALAAAGLLLYALTTWELVV
jgi:hypothetical protein